MQPVLVLGKVEHSLPVSRLTCRQRHWVPAFAGMTVERSGDDGREAGVTRVGQGTSVVVLERLGICIYIPQWGMPGDEV